jgi:hypothetical protein
VSKLLMTVINTTNKDNSPGRFYASVATKLIMAHVLRNFESRLVDEGKKTWISWRSYVLPREDALIEFIPR